MLDTLVPKPPVFRTLPVTVLLQDEIEHYLQMGIWCLVSTEDFRVHAGIAPGDCARLRLIDDTLPDGATAVSWRNDGAVLISMNFNTAWRFAEDSTQRLGRQIVFAYPTF